MTASDSVIRPINYIIWRKSGPVLTGPTGPAHRPLHIPPSCCFIALLVATLVTELMHLRSL